MQYTQPFDQPLNPNAGFINGNPGAGIAGSIPPAGALENPQREIVAVIAAAGLAPDNGDLQQLLKAVRGDVLGFYADAGTPNAILVNPLPAYLGQPGNGTRFRVRLANPITAGATFQVNTNTPLPMVKSGGAALTGGEGFQASDVVSVTVDGGYAKVSATSGSGAGGGLIPTGNVVLNVPGQYPTIRAAVAVASRIFLPIDLTGAIVIAPGYLENCTVLTGPIQLPGAFGERWSIIAPNPVGGVSTQADLAGKSNADCLTLLRSRFQVEVRCVGTSAFEMRTGTWSLINGVLVTGDQTNSGGRYGIKVGDWATRCGAAVLGLANSWVHGFGLDNIRAELLSAIQCVNVGSTYSTAHCFHASHGSVLSNPSGNLCAMFGHDGIILQNAAQLAIDSTSGIQDIASNQVNGIGSTNAGQINATPSTGLRIQGNQFGINMALYSAVALSSNGGALLKNNSQIDVYMTNTSTAYTFGCNLPDGCSPGRATGQPGNNGSYIW